MGPGNIFRSTWPKKLCTAMSALIPFAGPSEILVLRMGRHPKIRCGGSVVPGRAMTSLQVLFLITTSKELAEKVSEEETVSVKVLEQCSIIQSLLDNYG